jgi:uncharacterized membrane protein
MKILLFNDNPVVRKLVALSAQKTKDDLSVVWSVEEIEEGEYDLLIIDDALYSEEVFEAITNRVSVQSLLLMATRGKAIPAGFDNIINKPFLPTDLVDMLVQIEKKLSSASEPSYEEPKQESSPYAINLEENLPESVSGSDALFEDESDDDLDLSDLEDLDENLLETTILDQDEVQEVQGLLDEAEEDDFSLDELTIDDSIGEDKALNPPETGSLLEEMEEEEFDFDSLIETDEANANEPLNSKEILDDNDFGEIDFSMPDEEDFESIAEESAGGIDTDEEDELALDDLADAQEEAIEPFAPQSDPLSELDELSEDAFEESEDLDLESLMDDEALGDLESTIEGALNDLDEDELSREVSSDDLGLDLDDLHIAEPIDDLDISADEPNEDFDELDMLDERELKKAIGEEVDEELSCYAAPESSGLVCEALDEVKEEVFSDEPQQSDNKAQETTSHAEGVEALQALLKALANENVAKSLKGMNISININFGNEQ